MKRPYKIIIQIPCHNEEQTLPATLAALPRELPELGARVEWLVVDDGSTDRTAEVARAAGVEHLVSLPARRGLGLAFQVALERCLALGADVIVTTDGDGQYAGQDVPLLVAPLLAGEADLVMGDRILDSCLHFSWSKRLLQRWGTRVVALLSGVPVRDAASGFRAYTRECARRLRVRDTFSHSHTTLLQAGAWGMRVRTVPIHAHPTPRPSRLARTMGHYLLGSAGSLLRSGAAHRPLRLAMLLVWPLLLCFGLGAVWGWQQDARELASICSISAGAVAFLALLGGLLGERAAAARRARQLLESRERSTPVSTRVA